jgi:hypothetical protein
MPWLKLNMQGKPFIWALCENGEVPKLRYTPDGIEAKPAMCPNEKGLMWVTKRVPTFEMVEQMKMAKQDKKTKEELADKKKSDKKKKDKDDLADKKKKGKKSDKGRSKPGSSTDKPKQKGASKAGSRTDKPKHKTKKS